MILLKSVSVSIITIWGMFTAGNACIRNVSHQQHMELYNIYDWITNTEYTVGSRSNFKTPFALCRISDGLVNYFISLWSVMKMYLNCWDSLLCVLCLFSNNIYNLSHAHLCQADVSMLSNNQSTSEQCAMPCMHKIDA